MAQLVEFFGDRRVVSTPAFLRGDLPMHLDRLLLTSRSVSELYSRLGEFLLHAVAVDGMWLGSPDENEQVQYHYSAGDGVAEFLDTETILIDENVDGPLARAWRTGVPQFACDWTDQSKPLPSAFWRERGLQFGWRSSCAIPIAGESGKRDILILYSKRPQFFGRDYIRRFVLQLHSLLGFALERLRLMDAIQTGQQALMLYKSAMDVSTHGILIAAAEKDLPICYVNPAFERITGYSAEEAIGRNCRFLQGTDTAQPQMETIREALSEGQSCTVELRNYRKNGTMFWNSVSIAPVLDEAGRTTHFIGVQKDITEVKTLLQESIHSNALYRALMGTAELVIGAQTELELLDGLCRLLVNSKLFSQVWIGCPNFEGDLQIVSNTGGELKDASGLPNILCGDPATDLTVRAWRLRQLQFTNDHRTSRTGELIRDSERRDPPSATAVVPLYRGGEIWALLTLQSNEPNIFSTELLKLMERIGRLAGHGLDALDLRHTLEEERKYQSWLARHDALTDLLNRRGLTERIEEAIARSDRQNQSMAVALIGLNGFRVLNELHGHPVCDLLLRTVADRLRTCLRSGDVAGRLGGDEFVLILENADEERLAALLPKVQTAVEGPIQLESGRTATIQTSIGVTLYPQDRCTPEHLLRHADRALCAFKEGSGTATCRWMIYQPEADAQKHIRQTTVLALFHGGNLRVHYQPLVNLLTGKVTGVEALARLVDKDGRILPPAEFLEHFGTAELTSLTKRVLAQSVQDLDRLDKAGCHLSVGINLEPMILNDTKSVLELCQQIESSGLAANRIVLELLEHTDTLSMNVAQGTLRDLKTSGVKIALDDVGTAYSSLLRMKEFPVDIVKLDRSFLAGLDRQPKELRFLINLVNLARSLGFELVAEGVENDASCDALAAMGVTYGQGYGIAMPMPLEELENWLQHHRPVPWTRPRTVLGIVALQLIGLDATARILPQRPDFLEFMQDCDSNRECEIGCYMNALGPQCAEAITAHAAFHAALSLHARQSNGIVKSSDFQAARVSYEEALFRTVLDASATHE
jgi:diguanylate cyclase (GGDEF)-like protein/PAS domain S-box-containing protein